jgi:predicted nucleotidyltransferase
METSREKIIDELKKFFNKRMDVVFVYLFGSVADNIHHFKSDIDVAVFLKGRGDRFEKRLKLMASLSKIFKKDVDVIVLNDANSVFLKYVIVNEGVLVFERNQEQRIDFEIKAVREYSDYLPYFKMYKDNILSNKKYDKVYH